MYQEQKKKMSCKPVQKKDKNSNKKIITDKIKKMYIYISYTPIICNSLDD